jgi:hypothetical protein
MVLSLVAGLAAVGLASAQTPSSDLPPPPGSLERELSAPPAEGAPPLAIGNALNLADPVEIPFILEGSHIIVDASIDGGPSRPFVFDTGAMHVISPDVASTFSTTNVRDERLGGIGPRISQAEMVRVNQIAIGSAILEDQVAAFFELPNIILDRGSRPRLAGLIGSELLKNYAVTIDYAHHLLTLNNPGFKPRAAFSLPLTFAISPEGYVQPSIPAELDGIPGDFVIDTGSPGQVFVSGKFELEHNPFAHYGKTLNFLAPGGIGGPTDIQMSFGQSLSLGPLTLAHPVVTGPAEAKGYRATTAGLLGAGVLGRFVTTIDYQAGRVYFAPITSTKLGTVMHGSGLSLDKPDHEAFEVLDILPGSGAERAGVQRGDRIVEIGGQSARDLSVADVGRLSTFPAHTSVEVRTSDNRRFAVSIGQLLP